MLAAGGPPLPADVGVSAAAVPDWRVKAAADRKLKKDGGGPPALELCENPDILATVAKSADRPALVVGFAAETGDVVAYAQAKRLRKGCDWIVANDVSLGTQTFGGDANTVHLIRGDGAVEDWPTMDKDAVAAKLAETIAAHLKGTAS